MRTLAMAALVGAVLLATGCFSARVESLLRFTSTEGHFAVTVPGSMTESTSTGAGPFAASVIHTFLLDKPGGPRFVVVYGDAEPSFIASMSAEAALDQFAVGNVDATNGMQISSRNLTISGLPGREQRIAGPAGTYVFRMVLAGTRLYSFSVTGTDAQVQQADSVVYLESFQIIP